MKTAVKTPTNAVTAKAAVGRGSVSPKFCTTKVKMYYSVVVNYDVFIRKGIHLHYDFTLWTKKGSRNDVLIRKKESFSCFKFSRGLISPHKNKKCCESIFFWWDPIVGEEKQVKAIGTLYIPV